MSRFKTIIRIALVASVMLFAAGVPASARTVAERTQAEITKQEQHRLPTFWHWMLKKLSRYAMAAN